MNDKSLDQRSKELDEKLEDNPIDQSVEVLVKDAKRRGRQILLIAISLFVDIILTAALTWLTFTTREIAIDVQNSKDTIRNNCKVGNEFRATEKALWTYVLNVPPSRTLTPEEETQRQKTITEFKAYLDKTFAPRDCNNIIEN